MRDPDIPARRERDIPARRERDIPARREREAVPTRPIRLAPMIASTSSDLSPTDHDPEPRQRSVVVAAPRGYCAGVDRAVVTVEKALETYGAPVYVRKQIVHNRHVVEDLEQRGAIFVEELDSVPTGSTVVFSAHGVSPAVHTEAKDRGLKAIDATCPLVTKVHHEARRFARDGMQIMLIGHAGHEEVEGTTGEAPEHITLVQSPADVDALEVPDPSRLAWLSQTTLSVDETLETVGRLREKFPLLMDPPSDDICYATQNRQLAVKQIAAHSDLVIVVGSANSSNSVRLVEVALEAGAKASYRIDNATEIDLAWLEGVESIGVTSGASVPDDLVRGVLDFLVEQGYPAAREERLTEESLVFALPPELRKDLRKGASRD
jgi:4-hydroxy-3-methylbut-2-enyl diphosphate reductase